MLPVEHFRQVHVICRNLEESAAKMKNRPEKIKKRPIGRFFI
jgi:hypothetical protein